MIYSRKRVVATIGLEDRGVVDMPEATLICPRHRSEDVKQIVSMLKAEPRPDKPHARRGTEAK